MLANSLELFSKSKFIRKYYRFVTLFCCILIIISRDVSLIINPRFWAEEGQIYFSYAFSHSWIETLTAPHLGYYSFFDNAVSLIAANFVPLRFAPFVTTFAAFLIQLLPISIVLFGNSLLWQDRLRKSLAVLIIMFTMLSNEIWLNTINSQFYLLLTTFLILLENLENISKSRTIVYRFMLVLAGLTGPVGCFLTPLFLYKAWVEKKRENIIQAGIILLCAIFQVITIGLITLSDSTVPSRFTGFNLSIFIQTVWIKDLLLPFLGPNITQVFSEILKNVSAQSPVIEIILDGVLLFLIVMFFRLMLKKLPRFQAVLLVGSFLLITLASFVSSIGDKTGLINATSGHRYFFTPNVIVLFLVSLNIDFQKLRLKVNRSLLVPGLLTLALCAGIFYFYFYHYPNVSTWGQEVAKWENNPAYRLIISPEGWTMELKK